MLTNVNVQLSLKLNHLTLTVMLKPLHNIGKTKTKSKTKKLNKKIKIVTN